MLNSQQSQTSLGNLSVLAQRGVVLAYYLLVAWCLCVVEWRYFSWWSFFLVSYIAIWVADFVSGLIHLYIDYRPLNFAKGFGTLYDYKGNRGSDEFIQLKRSIMQHASWFDHTVYSFKIHHRDASSNKFKLYRDFFLEFVAPASMLLLCSLFVSFLFPSHAYSAHLAYFDVLVSVTALHADHIHVCVHGSATMLWGNRIAAFLQKYKLIYAYKTHALHHKDGLTGFCFVTGHANFAVNWICKHLLRRGIIRSDDWYGIPRQSAI